MQSEGHALERLVAHLYEEGSRREIGGFPLSQRIGGYRNRKGAEVDLVFLSKELQTLRFGTNKRDQWMAIRGTLALAEYWD